MPVTRASTPVKKKRKAPAPKKEKKPSKTDSTDREYIVGRIMDKRIKNRKVEYLIKWKNYGAHENTWESAENCNCPELIAEFEKQHRNSDEKTIRTKASRPVLEKQMPEFVLREEYETLVEQMNVLRQELEEVKKWVVPYLENRASSEDPHC
uniref:Chromo domain-containing protein n=1 Tax=Panagrolaimus sp. JU765 TaxID=591449 RepID=A0AC34PXR7_9BILA